MKPKLISFKLCPFVQRVNIVLRKKQVDFELVYVDLACPPEWFQSLSPFGQVPLLQVEEGVLFESVAIVEYLEERYAPRLHPSDMFRRAQNRSWIEAGSDITKSAFYLTVKETEEEYKNVCTDLAQKLDRLESSLENPPYFNGSRFSLVDATYAPFFQRLSFLEELSPGIINRTRLPRVNSWREVLLQDEAVQKSHIPDLKSMYFELVAKRQGYISNFLDRDKYSHFERKSIY